jgi:hypothetical protein
MGLTYLLVGACETLTIFSRDLDADEDQLMDATGSALSHAQALQLATR